jgi:Family of unknown function (DUF6603)
MSELALQLPGVAAQYAEGPPQFFHVLLDLPGAKGEGRLTEYGPDQWRGQLDVNIGVASVRGFAILDLGAQPGMIVILAVELTPPVQLSFGFALMGVGGVVGINRSPSFDRLRDAMTSAGVAELLFPADPMASADHLLPVIEDCFPRRADAFVVGPTIKIAWGTPAIVSATIALLVSDDAVTLLGRVAIGLPFEKCALVRIEANVIGRADARGVAIDATLSHSHIVGIPIDGDFRLRVVTAGNGLFAFSAGGFHPAFPPPEGMTGMRRLAMRLSVGGVLEARLEAYLAITTNSAQFGARVELRVGVDGWGIHGLASFDTLFLFDPFRFEVGFTAMISVEAAGIDLIGVSLTGLLAGPSPWRISGRASVKVLFVRIPVPFPNLTWGEKTREELPPAADPVAELKRQLERTENWSSDAPRTAPLARLRRSEAAGAVNPWGTLRFTQRRLPLAATLTRMDGLPLGAEISLDVTGPGVVDGSLYELFIRQQFFHVDDRERLAGAGYDRYRGGFLVSAAARDAGRASFAAPSGVRVCIREGGTTTCLEPPPVASTPPSGDDRSLSLISDLMRRDLALSRSLGSLRATLSLKMVGGR